jgi:hypothetical protein
MAMAIHDRGRSRDDAFPERRFMPDKERERRSIIMQGYAVLAGIAAVSIAAGIAIRRMRNGE